MKKLLCAFAAMTAAAGLASAAAAAAPPSAPCKDDPRSAELDYILGTWEVRRGPAADAPQSAVVTFEKILGGCGLWEVWETDRDTGDGRGLMNYNRLTGEWIYHWIAGSGSTSTFTGNLVEPNEMRFVLKQPAPSGVMRLRHWTLSLLPDGRVRELSVGTEDGGKTWTTEYDLYWKKTS